MTQLKFLNFTLSRLFFFPQSETKKTKSFSEVSVPIYPCISISRSLSAFARVRDALTLDLGDGLPMIEILTPGSRFLHHGRRFAAEPPRSTTDGPGRAFVAPPHRPPPVRPLRVSPRARIQMPHLVLPWFHRVPLRDP